MATSTASANVEQAVEALRSQVMSEQELLTKLLSSSKRDSLEIASLRAEVEALKKDAIERRAEVNAVRSVIKSEGRHHDRVNTKIDELT